MEGDLLPVI